MGFAAGLLMSRRTSTTFLLVAALSLLTIITGYLLFGAATAVILLLFGGIVAFSLPGTSADAQLRGLQPIRYAQAPELHDMTAALARSAGLARSPAIYLSNSGVMNAATLGDGSGTALIVTTGLLRRLSRRELYSVLAHEIAHIRNEDLTLFRFTESLRQAVGLSVRVGWILVVFALPIMLATGSMSGSTLLALFAAPAAATVIQAALLRTREFEADRTAAALTGDPEGLAQALHRIEYVQENMFRMLLPTGSQIHPLFRTHPPTKERVARLLALARGAEDGAYARTLSQ
jgi:heat shock protein HtpX